MPGPKSLICKRRVTQTRKKMSAGGPLQDDLFIKYQADLAKLQKELLICFMIFLSELPLKSLFCNYPLMKRYNVHGMQQEI